MSTDSNTVVRTPWCYRKSRIREVQNWADSQGITVHYRGSKWTTEELVDPWADPKWDEWEIPIEQDRLLFSLKWG